MRLAFFLRNEQHDDNGCPSKWAFLPNAAELIAVGNFNVIRGYVSGDVLKTVNDKPEVFNQNLDENLTDIEIAESMFALYNRGSGQEREFAGPSMSPGDLVVLVGCWFNGRLQGDVTVLQCADSGWQVLNPVLTDAKAIFDTLPLPATGILLLKLSARA